MRALVGLATLLWLAVPVWAARPAAIAMPPARETSTAAGPEDPAAPEEASDETDDRAPPAVDSTDETAPDATPAAPPKKASRKSHSSSKAPRSAPSSSEDLPGPLPPDDPPDTWRSTHVNRLMVFGVAQMPSKSKLNVNNVLGLSRTEIDLQWQTDLTIKNDKNAFFLKPRLLLQRGWRFDGIYDGQTTDLALGYAQELRYQRKLTPDLIASYGAENLQWGPSQLVALSNPFLHQNGRLVRQIALPALDYGRLVWVPNSSWSLSLIANTSQGLMRTYGSFEKVYAAKVDWTGDRKNASVVVSHTERRISELGGYGVWNITDPLVLYTEGRIAENHDDYTVLMGGTYTFESTKLLTLEYFYDNLGSVPILEDLFTRWQILDGTTWTQYQSVAVIMAQFNTGQSYRRFNGTARVDYRVDNGIRFSTVGKYSLTPRKELTGAWVINGGPDGTGFRLYTDTIAVVGITHTF